MPSKPASTPPSVTDQYLAALLAQPAVSTITLADGQPVPVEQVYVPRTLLHEVVQKKPERESEREVEAGSKAAAPEREITVKLPVELWPKLRDERVVLVEGPAGMGKSTLTKQLVRESGAHHLIPIWIPFRAFVASRLSLRDYLEQHYVPWLGLARLRVPYRADGTGPDRSLGQWCYEQWQSGLGLLIVDGLDEVFRHDERVTVLRGLPITGTGVTRPATILTSRPLSQSLPLQMAKVEVQGLTPSDQIQFIERYRASLRLTDEQVTRFASTTTKQEQGRLRELLTRPGHLIQILTTYARANTLLDTETAILDQLLKSRLSIKDRSDPPVEGDDAEKKRLVLASLALHLLACRQGQRHTRAQLLALIQQVLREHATHSTPLFSLAQATALLNDLTRNSALLTEVEPEVYEFETVVWLQHLTGTALADPLTIATLNLTDTQVLDFLDKKAWDPEWEPVLMSWVGMSADPFPLFERLTNKEQDDLARHRLGTAGRCLFEVNSALKEQPVYWKLARWIPMEAFTQWKVEVARHTVKLVELSLRGAWVETEVGQQHLLTVLGSPTMRSRLAAMLARAMSDHFQDPLVMRLADPDSYVRWAACRALSHLGTAMPAAVQAALMVRLEDWDENVRLAACQALSHLGTAMSATVQAALMVRLEDPDRLVREAAGQALSHLGTAMPATVQTALMVRLEDPDSFVCKAAGKALGQLGTAISAVVQAALMERLMDWDEKVRLAACQVRSHLGTAMPAAVQTALVAQLEDPNGQQHRNAVECLSSAQQQGLRLFPHGVDGGPGRLVSELSVTVPFSDDCFGPSISPKSCLIT